MPTRVLVRPLALVSAVAMLATLMWSSAASATPVPAPTFRSSTASALDWTSAELKANHWQLPSSFSADFIDWGLTVDAVLALAGGGRGQANAARRTTDNIRAHAGSYITDIDFGAGTERYAGPIGKLLLMTLVERRDPTNVGGFNLVAESRARMLTSGPQAGRFSDLSQFGDFSNGFGQAFNILALARTTSGVPARSVRFLLAQQCPNGGFRLFYDSGNACTNNAEVDTDATAMAVQALQTVPTANGAQKGAAAAVSWLLSIQDRTTGSFSGSGPTATPRSNSTGLVAAALRSAGKVAQANRAGTWVQSMQLTTANAGTGPAGADVGAIALDPAARDDAIANGIATFGRDQFRRATTQGVFAFGLGTYGQIGG